MSDTTHLQPKGRGGKAKTTIVTLALLAVLLALYGAALMYFSWRTSNNIEAWSRKLATAAPQLHIGASDYSRGLFSSTQTMRFDLAGPRGKVNTITLINRIEHGPLPGFTSLGSARIHHHWKFDDETAKVVDAAFGGQPPFEAVTLIGFNGDGVSEIKGAPANVKSAGGTVEWRGITGTLRFSADMANYSGELAAPGVVGVDEKGTAVRVTNIAMKLNQTRLANSENLYLGTVGMKIDEVFVGKSAGTPTPAPDFELRDLTGGYEVSSADGQFVDLVGSLKAAKFNIASVSGTDAEYALSLRHLHALSLEQLTVALQAAQQRMVGKPGAAQTDPMAAMTDMQAALKTHGLALFQRGPVFAVDRIGFKTADGEFKVTGKATISNVSEADFQAPFAALSKIDASADIVAPEAMARAIFTASQLRAAKADGAEPPAEQLAALKESAAQAFGAMVAQYQQLGYLVYDKQTLSSHLAFKDGQFTVNGKPFGGMGAGAAETAPPAVAPAN